MSTPSGILATSPAAERGGALRARQLIVLTGLFWAYVTLSNVLYAYSMRTGLARLTDMPLFAPWDVRVLQHAILLPFLLVSYWASLRIRWRPWWSTWPLQVLLGVAFAAVAYPAMVAAELLRGDMHLHDAVAAHGGLGPWSEPLWRSLWVASWITFLPAYGFGLALVSGLSLYVRYRDSEVRIANLEHAWSTARLAALRMQLSPHTLFNLLHTIRGEIEWDPKAAQSMLVQFSDLLRRLLSAGGREFVSLSEELKFTAAYLELQQRRFPDRLSLRLPSPQEAPALWVPSLILQPLVENAVVHGLAGHAKPVTVEVEAGIADGRLTLTVVNDLAAIRPQAAPGIGLVNVRERLAVLFPGRASLVTGLVGGRWHTQIALPALREAPESRPAPAATGRAA